MHTAVSLSTIGDTRGICTIVSLLKGRMKGKNWLRLINKESRG